MSDSPWSGKYAAIACYALLLVLVAWLSWDISAKITEIRLGRVQTASLHIEYAQDRIRQTCINEDPATLLDCVTVEVMAAQDNGRAESDLDAQQAMALWAKLMTLASVLGLGVTTIGVYLVWGTLDQTRAATSAAQDAVSVTREIGQAQTRAYVSINHSAVFESIRSQQSHVMGMEIVNSGQTPAYDVSFAASLFVERADFIPDESFWIQHDFDKNGQNSHLPNGSPIRVAGDIFLEHLVAMNIHAGHHTIFAACHLTYTDVFKQKHTTRVVSGLKFIPLGLKDGQGNSIHSPMMAHLPKANLHT